jgi:long-chain acyl-CoA synthetase
MNESFVAADSAVLLPLPLFHVYGSVVQAVSMIHGVPLILVPNPRDVSDVVRTIHRDRPAIMVGVPTLYSAITNHPKVIAGRIDFSSLKACTCGAAALLAETQRRFEQLTGASILEGYSLTEAIMACCGNPYRGERRPGSVGLPYPDVNVRLFDADEGKRELPAGEVGEVVLSAPQIMSGYWNNPSETQNAIRTLTDGSTALFTGDLGYLDQDGYLFLVDRKKDLIKTSGYQVWPREVEEVIATHPDVFEVGVAGLPDERKGEIVAAWIVPKAGTSPDPASLREFCKGKLAAYKVPSRIELRAELPKTLVGKILRRALVAEATR